MKQALGGDTSEGNEKQKPSIWISLKRSNHIQVQIKKVPNSYKNRSYKRVIAPARDTQELDYKPLFKYVKVVKKQIPQIDQAFIVPHKKNDYEEIILVMDQLRKVGIFNLGISPL